MDDYLSSILQFARDSERADLPRLRGFAAELKAIIRQRERQAVRAQSAARVPGYAAVDVRWLTPEEAAEIANLPKDDAGKRKTDRIYRWSVGQAWASRPTRRTLRINEDGFRRWLMNRR